MHLLMLVTAIVTACSIRWLWFDGASSWNERWQRALVAFVLPPGLLLTTAIAIGFMGPRGQMVRWWEGWGIYGLATGFLTVAFVICLRLLVEMGRSLHKIHQYSAVDVHGTTGRLIDSRMPYIAQVGFWRSELIVSQGLLKTLDEEHLKAVLVHEQAHCDHRDTFWFFWLGWLRRLTAWLPQTDALWQELLILRELRADQYAAQHVDGLLLAEALLLVVSAPMEPEMAYAEFSAIIVRDRLTERINALLAPPSESLTPRWTWLWLGGAFLPLLAIPFHV
ncbi:M48 family metalloprotease [Leptolyngbya sp. FACHB-36]|uniref:M56 family metallopeptidase n=1 Tax=Leptolyngbya sp. FACHB-36 TaxID=2692808 RepID=UPI001681749A|nr:M56 family metallopeptidase [Leptolyngbya sp. FACHB-36]MBD2020909.1 M48 family metalloprotease [Leptolyngbya sp. FACHB-36]